MAASVDDKLANAPRLSIVVLPFENLSGDKEQDYFADGITDDLTTDLSHLPDSFVIARNTAFTYKGKPVDVKQIGRELGVRYLLEGSVRGLEDKISVNAQLISTETGAHVWADRFDGERSKLGELQVEFVSRLANSLGVELVKAESLRAMRERPNNPDATDLAMRAEALWSSSDESKLGDVMNLFERALALDPHNLRAMTGLAGVLQERVTQFASKDPSADIARADELINAALALQPDNSWAHDIKAWLFFAKRQFGPATAEAETAIAEDRNYADAYAAARLFPAVSRPQRERLCERRKGASTKSARPGRAVLAILHVPSPFPSRPVGTGDRMVQQVNRRRPYEFFPAGRPHRRQRLARSRQRGKGGRGPIAEGLSRLHRANLGGPSL